MNCPPAPRGLAAYHQHPDPYIRTTAQQYHHHQQQRLPPMMFPPNRRPNRWHCGSYTRTRMTYLLGSSIGILERTVELEWGSGLWIGLCMGPCQAGGVNRAHLRQSSPLPPSFLPSLSRRADLFLFDCLYRRSNQPIRINIYTNLARLPIQQSTSKYLFTSLRLAVRVRVRTGARPPNRPHHLRERGLRERMGQDYPYQTQAWARREGIQARARRRGRGVSGRELIP